MAEWKLVPVEPTEGMMCAPRKDRPGFSGQVAREVYQSMLAAAPQAPSGQQAETDETWRRRAEHLDREMKAARVDVDSEIVEGQLKDFLLRFGGKYDGNGMWDVSLYLEDICQVMSALAGQQSERPAPAGQAVGERLVEIERAVTAYGNAKATSAMDTATLKAELLSLVQALAASQAERPAVKEDGNAQ
jgi:hypothetical protein